MILSGSRDNTSVVFVLRGPIGVDVHIYIYIYIYIYVALSLAVIYHTTIICNRYIKNNCSVCS